MACCAIHVCPFRSARKLIGSTSTHHIKNSSAHFVTRVRTKSVNSRYSLTVQKCLHLERKLWPQNLHGSSFAKLIGLRHFSSNKEVIMNVFDRNAKRIQRNRTAKLEDYKVYDYIKEEIGYRVADRICDVKRLFNVAVDLGCGRGHVSKHIYKDMVKVLYQTDFAEDVLAQSELSPEVPTYKMHVDEEFIPFAANSLDLVVSSLSLHWVNDLPGCFKQIHHALRPDGCLLGAMFGGDTLFELRCSLQLAETDLEGGISPHISPFTSAQDLGGLLSRAGYTLLTIDNDELVINYPSIYELMKDLQGMGENNCLWSRRSMIPRATLKAAAAKYTEMYGNEDGSVPATYQILNFIAWKPDPSQKQAAKRGSGEVSLKDLDKLDDLSKQISDLKSSLPDSDLAGGEQLAEPDWSKGVDKLAQDIDKLRQQVQKGDGDDGTPK